MSRRRRDPQAKGSLQSRGVTKVLGADTELGNFMEGTRTYLGQLGTSREASSLLLRQIRGIAGTSLYWGKENPQDIGRKWLTNGSCCYIDLDHIETCIPEVTNAWDFTASFHAQLRIVQEAQKQANAALPHGSSVRVLACNSDGSGASWGSHINVQITRQAFEAIFSQRPHYLLWLASYQAASSVITGQGKVGSENGAPPVEFQLSQRADFFEAVAGLQTTFHRPLINSRDEPLCRTNSTLARFHHIACDINLCHVANVLKTGILQLLLAMVEKDSIGIQPEHMLDEPVAAFRAFSHDPEMNVRMRTISGDSLTAVELQRRFHQAAAYFVEHEDGGETVPRAAEILELWSETLDMLAEKQWEPLSARLDWALKRQLLEGVLADRPELTWASPEIKRLDLLYGSLDQADGLYWAMERAGIVQRVVAETDIERFVTEPPSDTRAYTRAHVLREFGSQAVVQADWDMVRVRKGGDGWLNSRFAETFTVPLDQPLAGTQAQNGGLFKRGRAASQASILASIGVADLTAWSRAPYNASQQWGSYQPAPYDYGASSRDYTERKKGWH